MITTNHQTNFEGDVSGLFTLETNAHIFKMLTTNIYSDIILAGIREISCNGLDANILTNSTIPINVHLPTEQEPFFSVRDTGPGLSEQDITTLYSTAGASTKRNSNNFMGSFGIGKLAALAYASSFTVDSYYNGTYFSYLITIKDGIPAYIKLHETPTTEPNGLCVSYPVQLKDIPKFVEKASFLYRFFSTRPTTNLPLTYQSPTISGSNWCLYPDINYSYVVMANVPYKLNYTLANGLCLQIPTGSVSINPGRESLSYDSQTTAYIDSLIDQVKADISSTLISNIQSIPTILEQAIALKASASLYSFLSKTPKAGDISPTLSQVMENSSNYYLKDQPYFKVADVGQYSSRIYEGGARIPDSIPTHILIQDVPTGFLKLSIAALQDKSLKSALLLRPTSNTKASIQVLLDNFQSYLDTLEITPEIVYISSYADEKVKSTSTKLATTTFRANDISGGVFGNIDTSTDTSTFYYFLEQPSDPIYSKLEQLLNLKFIVVPKRAHTLVQSLPNFHLVTDSLTQSLLDPLQFSYISESANNLRSSRFAYSFPNFPTRINLYETCRLADSFKPTHSESLLTQVQTRFKLNVTCLDVPLSIADIERTYPQLHAILNIYKSNQVATRYTYLEDFYALHSTS